MKRSCEIAASRWGPRARASNPVGWAVSARCCLLLGAVLALAGCATDQPADTEKPAMRALGEAVTTPETVSDESIGAEIRRQMNIADPAGTAGVIIEVSDGVVTLSGTATGLTGAWRAEAVAHAVAGVREVRNEILIQQTGGK